MSDSDGNEQLTKKEPCFKLRIAMFSELRAQMKADIYIFINDISSQCG